jgi:hypothetical protein
VNEPRTSPEFDDILAQCLDEVLRGQKSLAECLTAYPAYAADLKPALQIGLLTARLKSPEMSSQSVDALEMRLRAQHAQMRPTRSSNIIRLPLGISRLAAAIAVIFILTLGSGAGLVAASADDLPGDTLYGVKRLWETILLALVPLTGQPGDLWLWIANARLDEANALADKGLLTENALIDLYTATYHASQYGYGDGDASAIIAYFNRAYLALMNRNAPLGAEAVYRDMVEAVAPSRVQNGTIIPLISELPPSLSGVVPLASPTPIEPRATFTATNTASPTSTTTETPTITVSPTPSATRTPRIPATATRTPTFTPSPTATPTLTPSPTMTWTALPLPYIPPITGAATQVPPGFIPSSTPQTPPTPDGTERIRETQQSVFLTQTAGPPISTPMDGP